MRLGFVLFCFFNNYCPARSLSFSKVTDPFENLPQKNAHMHTHHIDGLHEPLKTSHGHPQIRDPGDFSGYKNYLGICENAHSQDPPSRILTQDIWGRVWKVVEDDNFWQDSFQDSCIPSKKYYFCFPKFSLLP